MSKLMKLAALLVALLLCANVALAQEETQDAPEGETAVAAAEAESLNPGLAGIGAGICCIGGGLGIGLLAGRAMEGMARQPEIAGSIQTAMIIAAALIEGFTFFAIFVCFSAL